MRNRRYCFLLVALLLVGSVVSCGQEQRATEAATSPGVVVIASPRPTHSPTASPFPVPPTAVRTATSAPTTSPSPSASPTPTVPTPTPSSAPPTQTLIPTSTSTPLPTPTPQPTQTSTPSPSPPVPGDPRAVRVELQRIVGGLTLPVGIANAGDGSGRLFVLEKAGRIRVVHNGQLLSVPFMDISDRVGSGGSEQGLLGLAFHPDYARNGSFIVNYTDRQGKSIVARFAVGPDPAAADPSSEMVLLTLGQPAANHNGGHLAFGPDGYLYAGFGDGGGAGDGFGNGQNGQTLLGAMLRLDVDSGVPYAVPPDNPFVGNQAVRDEIWAIGLRNPWRFSFDRQTGALYIADVGQNTYEEVNVRSANSGGGENYGWPIMEAAHCFPEDAACDRSGLILPVAEYDHSQGCSVTGGYVYRGREFPLLAGIYLFGDYCSGRIWGLAPEGDGWRVAQLGRPSVQISSFGEDEDGELYLLHMGGGELFKIVAHPR